MEELNAVALGLFLLGLVLPVLLPATRGFAVVMCVAAAGLIVYGYFTEPDKDAAADALKPPKALIVGKLERVSVQEAGDKSMVLIDLSIVNGGFATSLGEWSLTIQTPNGTFNQTPAPPINPTNALAVVDDFKNPTRREVYEGRDCLLNQSARISMHERKVGWLLFEPDVRRELIAMPEAVYSIHYRDSYHYEHVARAAYGEVCLFHLDLKSPTSRCL